MGLMAMIKARQSFMQKYQSEQYPYVRCVLICMLEVWFSIFGNLCNSTTAKNIPINNQFLKQNALQFYL